MSEPTPSQRLCLNCDAELQGAFCHCCGQKVQSRRLPLKALLHDVVHDLWHLDHKVLESLWLLVRHPGFLAEEYLNGRRVRHLPPFRLYVLTSFALFLAFSLVPVGPKEKDGKPTQGIHLTTPTVTDEKRISMERLSEHFVRVIMTFGYIETPNVTKALSLARKRGEKFDIMTTSFFLNRRTFRSARHQGLPFWQERLFIGLSKSAADATAFYCLPSNRVVEMGQQMAI